MEDTHNWITKLYVELGEKITEGMPEIKWVDLWHNQVGFLETEHPFSTPALFISIRSNAMNDMGQKIQNVGLQIDFYLYYETFVDTYKDGFNQEDALEFLNSIDNLHKLLHGSTGDNYTAMRRIGFNPEDTGNAGNLYRITYECNSIDYNAHVESEEGTFNDVAVDPYVVD